MVIIVAIYAILSIIALLFLIFWFINVRKYEGIRRLPGPGVFQVIKNMFDSEKSAHEIFTALISLNKYYGSIVKLWINPVKPILIVADTKYVEYFLKSNVHLDKSNFYNFLKPYIGNGLASSTAQVWKLHRKLLNPAFHHKIIDNYAKVFEKYWSQLVGELRQKACEESVDVFPILNNHTLNILCETFLDLKKYEVNEYYMPARTGFYSIITERILSLVKHNDFMYRFTRTFRKQEEYVKIMKNFAKEVIDNYRSENSNVGNDDALKKQGLMNILFRGLTFSETEIQDHINTIIIAGHDTTASVLSFSLFELSKHLDIQKKILTETNLILGNEDKNTEITFHDVQQMKYVECVLKEILRLYAPVPFFDRTTKEDVTIGDATIPEGTDISICAFNLHRSNAYFPDAEKFDPDRFLPENIDSIPDYAFVPFSAGPRNCIGKNFAMLEMKSAIAKVIRNFELHSVEHELKLSTEFVLKSDSGMRIKLKLR